MNLPYRFLVATLALPLCFAALGCGSGPEAVRSEGAEEGPAHSSAATSAPQAPAPVPYLWHGIDVSGHSGTVAWPTVVAEGHTFAFIKATEGMDLKDPQFDAHWPAMKAAGIVRGAYHFYVTEDDPEAQARFFIETVDLAPGDLVPVVDVEVLGHDTRPGLAERLKAFLDALEAHYGVKPMIYTAVNFWDAHLTDEFGEYPLWLAEYGVEEPRLPSGWSLWHLWQWQGDAAVPGVEKSADLSRVNHTLGDLATLLVPE